MSPLVKRLSWALALSLGLNVFVLGFESARWFQRRAHSGEHAWTMQRPMHGRSPELKAERERLFEARRHVGEALAREPLERAQLEQAFAALREETSRGQKLLHERLIERAQNMSAEERRAFARGRFARDAPDE